MANLKAITGHTSARGVMRYLERGGRALARDFLNLAPPVAGEGPGDLPEHGPYDWAAAMDATRAAAGNDLPWRGRAARTWKHYVISPDPRNGVSLDELRELATAWPGAGSPTARWPSSTTTTTPGAYPTRTSS